MAIRLINLNFRKKSSQDLLQVRKMCNFAQNVYKEVYVYNRITNGFNTRDISSD